MCHAEESVARQHGSGQARNSHRQTRHAESSRGSIQTKQPDHAPRKRAAIRRHQESRRGAPFLHDCERARVLHGVAAKRNGFIVTAMLALRSNPLAHPPNRRVVKQQCLYTDLKEIHEAVQPSNVRKLVRDDHCNLFFA